MWTNQRSLSTDQLTPDLLLTRGFLPTLTVGVQILKHLGTPLASKERNCVFVLNLQTKGSFSRLIIIIIGRNVFVRIVSVRFSFHLRIMFFV
jgi:hypothetical protein